MVLTRSQNRGGQHGEETSRGNHDPPVEGVSKSKPAPTDSRVDPNYPGNNTEVIEKLADRLQRIEAENHDMARVLREIYRRLPPAPGEEHDSSRVSVTPRRDKRTAAETANLARREERKGMLARLGYSGKEHREAGMFPRDTVRPKTNRSHRDNSSEEAPIDAIDVQEIVKAELSQRRLHDPHANRERARQALLEENTSPFVAEIAEAPAPKKFSRPTFKLFDGKTDPTSHLRHYKQNMTFWTHDEATMCRVFPTSLGDKPLRWFTNLPQGKIESFAELSELFVARFITNRPGPKEIGALYSVHRKKDESLRAYLNRYFDLCQDVRGCTERTKIDAFKHGLATDHPLYDNLVLSPPMDVHDLTARIENYATLEETKKLRLPSAIVDNRKKDHGSEKSKDFDRHRSKDRRRDKDRRRGKEHDEGGKKGEAGESNRKEKRSAEDQKVDRTGVIFTLPLPQLLEKIKHEKYLRWPRPMGGERSARRQDVFCDFHNDVGHRTRDCISLKNHLEDLAKRGNLAEFIKEGKDEAEGGRPAKKRAEDKSGSFDTVDVIHFVANRNDASKRATRNTVHRAMLIEKALGSGAGEDMISVASYKKGETPALCFSDADLAGVEIPHTDALVIKARIDVRNVKRILIDAGSSTDIIYLNLYRNLPGIKLKPVEHPVFGFSGEPTWPLGTCTLNVRLGPVSTPVDFLVIGVEAPYNAILGRSWLGAVRAVASSYHQKIKFHSSEGVVTVRSSQSAARTCFQMAVRTTATERRPPNEEQLDADTRLALAVSAGNSQGIVIKEPAPKETIAKRKAEEEGPSAKHKQKTAA